MWPRGQHKRATVTAVSSTEVRDDRILPFTHVVAAAVIVVLVFAFIVLFLLPGQTDRRFAWTIHPSMTAMLMGAGYGSAIYFFVHVLTERRWHRVGPGFLPMSRALNTAALIVMKIRCPLGKLVEPGCSVTRRIWPTTGRDDHRIVV